jgi:hypothetical protein
MQKGDGMRGKLRLAAALLALAATAGCRERPGARPAPTPPVMVHVVNQNRSDINVFVLRGGTRTRLGMVVSGDARIFPLLHLPASAVHQLGFEVQRIGAEGLFALPRVTASAGDAVHIRIQELLTTSEISVVGTDAGPAGKQMP